MRHGRKRSAHFLQVFLCEPNGFQLTGSEFVVVIRHYDIEVSLSNSAKDETADEILPFVKRRRTRLSLRLSLTLRLFYDFRLCLYAYALNVREFVVV